MPASAANLRGVSYVSTLAFIDHKFGAGARDRVLRRLSPEDRALVGGIILPIGMYPLATFGRFLRAMDQELGAGDLSLSTERGQWAAIHDMKTTHKLLLKFMTPSWVVEKGTSLWRNWHDTGRWETEPLGKTGAKAVLHELGHVDEAFCATLKGWISGLLTVAGCKQIKVQHGECRAHGASSCVWTAGWQ